MVVSGCSLLLPGYISLTIKTTNLELVRSVIGILHRENCLHVMTLYHTTIFFVIPLILALKQHPHIIEDV